MIYANAAAAYCILNEDECQIDGWGWLWLIVIIAVCLAVIWWCED